MKQPKVAIVILNWNGWRDTLECLQSLFNQSYTNFQVVVCDNASTDESEAKILGWCKGTVAVDSIEQPRLAHLVGDSVRGAIEYTYLSREEAFDSKISDIGTPVIFIQNGANLGFAGGNNSGLRLGLSLGADYCWLLNNDTVVETDCLEQMVSHSDELSRRGIKNTCGSVQCFYDDPNVIQALGGFGFSRRSAITSETFGRYLTRDDYSKIDHKSYASKLDAIHGCSWLLSREYLEEVGLMDDRYFLYYEEIDWALRAKGKFELTYAPQAFVYHKEGASIGSKSFKRARSAFSEYHIHKSRLRFVRKHLPLHLPQVALFSLLQAVNRFKQRLSSNGIAIFKALLRLSY